jgi:K+-transporting ATPase KdpF subunit
LTAQGELHAHGTDLPPGDGLVRRHDLAAQSPGKPPAGPAMSGLDILGLFLAVALGVYLLVALLRPDKFE